MKNNKKKDFDDTETAEDIIANVEKAYGKLSYEELDELIEKIFGDDFV